MAPNSHHHSETKAPPPNAPGRDLDKELANMTFKAKAHNAGPAAPSSSRYQQSSSTPKHAKTAAALLSDNTRTTIEGMVPSPKTGESTKHARAKTAAALLGDNTRTIIEGMVPSPKASRPGESSRSKQGQPLPKANTTTSDLRNLAPKDKYKSRQQTYPDHTNIGSAPASKISLPTYEEATGSGQTSWADNRSSGDYTSPNGPETPSGSKHQSYEEWLETPEAANHKAIKKANEEKRRRQLREITGESKSFLKDPTFSPSGSSSLNDRFESNTSLKNDPLSKYGSSSLNPGNYGLVASQLPPSTTRSLSSPSSVDHALDRLENSMSRGWQDINDALDNLERS
ncbi:hypothetical protein G7Y89_g2293 [Cudoniella acicularis]|uniref:Uncharacterized protein n=1 Tax=Cudoniella acicularis TaxID=354080 RepID=A0A8H4RVM2_9HELO|nr:hypothetical protein G7Y89_g2293 [Cudoniella acicularis]